MIPCTIHQARTSTGARVAHSGAQICPANARYAVRLLARFPCGHSNTLGPLTNHRAVGPMALWPVWCTIRLLFLKPHRDPLEVAARELPAGIAGATGSPFTVRGAAGRCTIPPRNGIQGCRRSIGDGTGKRQRIAGQSDKRSAPSECPGDALSRTSRHGNLKRRTRDGGPLRAGRCRGEGETIGAG